MKKIVLIAIILSSFVFGANYEINYLYKDERSLGMGGVGVANGGKAPSVFLNPAGLSKMVPDGGIDFSLLPVNIGINDAIIKKQLNGTYDFRNSGDDIAEAVSQVLGENINIDANTYSYLAAKIGIVTASVGIFTSSNTNMQIHSGFGPSGVIEFDTTSYAGMNLSSSFSIEDSMHLGVGVKYITSYAKRKNISLGDLLEPDFAQTLQSDMSPTTKGLLENSAPTLDIGAIYDLDNLRRVSPSRFVNKVLDTTNPSVGVSVLNIGSYLTSDKEAYIPQTINAGITFRPYCTWFRELVVSSEVHDVLNGYSINKSRGILGKFRAGFEGYLIKNILMDMSLRGGYLNGSWSAGFNTRIAFLHIGLTTYVEEMGGYVGQASDRRYLVNLGAKF